MSIKTKLTPGQAIVRELAAALAPAAQLLASRAASLALHPRSARHLAALRRAIGAFDERTLFEITQMRCLVCGCTADDCEQCIEKTGEACTWAGPDLCSACVE